MHHLNSIKEKNNEAEIYRNKFHSVNLKDRVLQLSFLTCINVIKTIKLTLGDFQSFNIQQLSSVINAKLS